MTTTAILVALLLHAAQLSDCEVTLYPFRGAAGDVELPRGDDQFSQAITLSTPFSFFGNSQTQLFINTNGIISFDKLVARSSEPRTLPLSSQPPMLAPYWADADATAKGSIWYGERSNNSNAFSRAQNEVRQYFSSQQNFVAKLVFIATWDQVLYNTSATETNTFQSILISDGVQSFAIFQYSMIEWTTGADSGGMNGLGGRQAEIGYDAGDSVNFERVPLSGTAQVINITSTSNIGMNGVWVFSFFNSVEPEPATTQAVETEIPTTESLEEELLTTTSAKSCDFGKRQTRGFGVG